MAKRPTLSPSARKMLQAERRKLDKQRRDHDANRLDEAREDMLRRADQVAAWRRVDKHRSATVDGTRYALRSITQAVAASWGVKTPINLNQAGSLSAWTDFKTIQVAYPWEVSRVDGQTVGDGVEQVFVPNVERLTQVIIEVKAAVYHEVGHNLFTIPWPAFVEQFHQAVFGKTDPFPEELVGSLSVTYLDHQRMWNIIEDQRQEAALVAASPIIGTYLTALISQWFDVNEQLWLFVAGRHYLPADLRAKARQLFVDAHGEHVAAEVQRIIHTYQRATTVEAMGQALLDFINLLADHNVEQPRKAGTDHNNTSRGDGATPSPESGASYPSEDEGDDVDSDGEDDDGEDDDGGGSGAGNSTGDTPPGDRPTGIPGTNAGAGTDVRDVQDAVHSAAKEALDSLRNNAVVQNEVAKTMESIESHMNDPLPRSKVSTRPTPADWASVAETIAYDMERSFDARVADCAPMWQSRTTRGIIDPFAYRTREPGVREFYRLYDDRGDLGRSLSVSVLLDVSGSMQGDERNLSISGYAIAKACRALDIPVNVMTFHSWSTLLYGANDEQVEMTPLEANGGTDPSGALRALDEQVYGKRKHLVFILTDGIWSEYKSLREASATTLVERNIFVLGYGLGDWQMESFAKYGVTETQVLGSVQDLPLYVQNVIGSYLG